MRALTIALLIFAGMAMTASAGISSTSPKDDRGGMTDTCAENNARVAASCFQLPPGAVGDRSPVIMYVDTGRADAYPGIWQESGDLLGLQKFPTYTDRPEAVPPDTELL